MEKKEKKQYSATHELKARIIDTARKLFYEQGYKDTYLGQIASECGIAKPQISYHFKSKPNLAKEIAKQYTWEMKNSISMKYYELFNEKSYDLRVSTAVEIQIMNRLYYLDPKAFRFYKERAD